MGVGGSDGCRSNEELGGWFLPHTSGRRLGKSFLSSPEFFCQTQLAACGTGTRPYELFLVQQEEAQMPAILIPVLWVGGAVVLLGGGWYVIGHMVH